MQHFIPHHWLAGYPVGTQCQSYTAETGGVLTAKTLHKVLGDRREVFRVDDSADSLARIESLLNSLRRAN